MVKGILVAESVHWVVITAVVRKLSESGMTLGEPMSYRCRTWPVYSLLEHRQTEG